MTAAAEAGAKPGQPVLRSYADALTQPALGEAAVRHDEVVGPDGALRPAWKGLAEAVIALTPGELTRVDEEIVRTLADDGVTYSRPGERRRPWRLDPVPLVLDAATWNPLEVGLAQRAELLDAVLVDLYGKQRLLREGVVPAAVVLAHPGFLRVVARPSTRDPRPLVLAATDLGRDRHGEWRVLADRTQAPSGLGYAMENRRVVSRVLPELYREAGLHRVEPFLGALRSALLTSAQGDLPDPRVVVLSPGGRSETSYDQAFLASALGFSLVQGSDLVVRGGWVQMRAFGRLERVDVILRRVDSSWCDPLELRGDSRLGVAGLTEAVRRGRVRVVNGLGAGVLESPALLPYLPAVCEFLLGEPLRLAQVPTWWCGEPDGLEQVLDRLDDLIVRPVERGADSERSDAVQAADPSLINDGSAGGAAADEGRAALVERILRAPYRWVGQERLPLSQAPTWSRGVRPGPGGGLGQGPVAAPLTLRTFTLRFGSAYRPLAGGLASVTTGEELPGALPGSNVASKDVWVLKEPGAPDQGLPDVLALTSVRATTGVVPRVLEDMFWVGRYAERAEDLLRLTLAAGALADDFRSRPRSTGAAGLEVLLGALVRLAGTGPHDPRDPARAAELDDWFRSLLLDPTRSGSAAHGVDGLRSALDGVRDQISPDVWRALGTLDRATAALEASHHGRQVAESAGRMLTGLLALEGVTTSMIRDAGWRMVAVGRHLERAIQVCHLLAATTTRRRGLDVDREVLTAVLVAAESSITHRRRYRGSVRPGGVLELLLTDPENPRSLAFALAEVSHHLAALPASTGSSRPERVAADLRASVEGTDVAFLVAIGGEERPNLTAFLARTLTRLTGLADAVAELHLTAGPAPRPLAALRLVDSLEPPAPPAPVTPAAGTPVPRRAAASGSVSTQGLG